ncbi:hypothetical protein [Taro bacilliform CH virus]|uniref:Uncharacterized protein n=1 Tax=Taro bacilliform CH virus TaxID=1634914 RepID=A0A0E3JJD8_9VIRU|nr:hypothetical protein [Taro bacilliform CH virus]AKA45801.1 hypothetical protein [Taro bacilliform CH virus]AKA45807.1 hypothetical protein [Taro bacilliform CH virus]
MQQKTTTGETTYKIFRNRWRHSTNSQLALWNAPYTQLTREAMVGPLLKTMFGVGTKPYRAILAHHSGPLLSVERIRFLKSYHFCCFLYTQTRDAITQRTMGPHAHPL